MRRGFTAAAVRAAEAPLLAAGQGEKLMRTAAAGLAAVCRRALRASQGQITGTRVVALVGAGNNGGDALFAAANLASRGAQVTALDVLGRMHPAGLQALRSAGGRIAILAGGPAEPAESADPAVPDTDRAEKLSCTSAAQLLRRADLVIDGIFGTGAKPGLPEHIADLLDAWQPSPHSAGPNPAGRNPAGPNPAGSNPAAPLPDAAARQHVIAVDVPTGVDASTGACGQPHVRASETVTFGADKAGLMLPAGADAAGTVTCIDIGLDLSDHVPTVTSPTPADLLTGWPRPQPGDHKYSRGVLGLVAGSTRFPGAGVLAAASAVRTGVGMLRLLAPAAVTEAVLQEHPEVVTDVGRVQAWVIGPGAPDRLTMQHVITAAESADIPLVIDAGALSLLTRPLETSCILTPHAGELVELLTRVSTGVPERAAVEAEPVTYAARAAAVLEAVVLLKGRRTVIARPDGTIVAPPPGPANLATAGTGDVLTGILGALLATTRGSGQDLAELAGLAVLMHARAGGRTTHASGLPAAIEDCVLEIAGTV